MRMASAACTRRSPKASLLTPRMPTSSASFAICMIALQAASAAS
jgi:hypothetical protein